MAPDYSQQYALNILFCSLQYGLTNGKYFMDVDMFRTQRKWEVERQKIRQCIYTHRKGPSKGNENKLKKRQSYAEKNKFCHI
jgi:hypothetical protein